MSLLFVPEALVDPTAIVARSAKMGEGSFVNAGVVIGAAGFLGDRTSGHARRNRCNCCCGFRRAARSFERRLCRRQSSGERFEFLTDNHWNGTGHDVAVEAIRQSRLFKEVFKPAFPK